MVPLVPCLSITTCASRLNYINSCPWSSDLQRHCAWISAVMFHSSRRHNVKTTVAVLCLPSSGSTASSPVYCRQASLSSVRRQHTTTFHRTSLHCSSIVLHRHSRFSDNISKHSYFPVHTRASSLFSFSYCMFEPSSRPWCRNALLTHQFLVFFTRNNQICYQNFNVSVTLLL